MSTREDKDADKSIRSVSFILPIVNVLAVYLGLYISNTNSYINVFSAVCFVLCFDFIYLYYLSKTELKLKLTHAKKIVLTLAPVIGYFSLYFEKKLVTSILLFAAILMLVAYTELSYGLLALSSIICYSVLITGAPNTTQIINLIFILFGLVLFGFINDNTTLIYSELAAVIFYIITLTVTGKFILKDTFSLENIILCVCFLLLIFITYKIKARYVDISSTHITAEASELPVSDTSIDASKTVNNAENDIESIPSFSSQDAEKSLQSMTSQEADEALPSEASKETKDLEKTEQIQENDYIATLKKQSPKLYRHCLKISEISAEAAEFICVDRDLTEMLALYHEAAKFLGDDYQKILAEKYHTPSFIIRLISFIKCKEYSVPMNRETGIVILTDDIITTIKYFENSEESITLEKIVSKAIKFRKGQDVLRLCGFTNDEIQLLILFFTEMGGIENKPSQNGEV